MPHFIHYTVAEQHFHDVETDFDRRILDEPEVIEGRFREETPFAGIDGGGGARPILGGTSFDFDEDQAVLVAKDEVDFTPR